MVSLDNDDDRGLSQLKKDLLHTVHCVKEFPSEENLLRNMTGLLTKVADEQSLRPQLMSAAFVRELVGLLNSIKVSYNAVEVLVYLLSDGSEAWTILQPTREEVLGQIFCIMWSLVV